MQRLDHFGKTIPLWKFTISWGKLLDATHLDFRKAFHMVSYNYPWGQDDDILLEDRAFGCCQWLIIFQKEL